MPIRRILTVVPLILCVLGCSEAAPLPPPPEHKVVKIEEPSFGSVRRLLYRIQLPEHYSRDAVEQIARWTVSDLRKRGEAVNAVSMLFYGPHAATGGAYDVASIDWAPGGEWGNADSVRAGDYSTFDFSVSYNEPRPEPAQQLSISPEATGLFGAPLPDGARLIEQTTGDPEAGVDPSERYEVSGSAAEILSFFDRELPGAGWKKSGPVAKSILFFRKGEVTLGVLVDQAGGAFTLMGS